MRRRWAQAMGMSTLLVFGAVYALASLNWCPPWPERAAKLVSRASSDAPWTAGAAAVEVDVPYPVTLAGYGPIRSEASRANRAPKARAIVITSGGVEVALVSLDVVYVPQKIVSAVRARSGVPTAVLFGTHTHTSLGQYDERPMAELGGLSFFREAAQEALVRAAVSAIQLAKAKQVTVTASRRHFDQANLCVPRTGDACDGRLDQLVLEGPTGPVAQLILTAAHPVLVPRRTDALDSDYPGAFADEAQARGEGVTLVAQSAGGNASVAGHPVPTEQSQRLWAALDGGTPVQGTTLAIAQATTTLPHADGSRLVPALSRNPATNLACQKAEFDAELTRLTLGPLTLLTVPAEVTLAAAAPLEQATHARVLSLAGGYLGYVEPAEIAKQRGGESIRQYYTPELLDALLDAAKLTAPE